METHQSVSDAQLKAHTMSEDYAILASKHLSGIGHKYPLRTAISAMVVVHNSVLEMALLQSLGDEPNTESCDWVLDVYKELIQGITDEMYKGMCRKVQAIENPE